MNAARLKQIRNRYAQELKHQLLPFWLEKSPDWENGGCFNCFDVWGRELFSHDKYIWSQGRFLWMWSRMCSTKADIFTSSERENFRRYADLEADFLRRHCLMPREEGKPICCVYLTDAAGTPKVPAGCTRYDSSIYADMFVVGGFAQYAIVTGRKEDYLFARELYLSVRQRLQSGDMQTQPYPLDLRYGSHGPLMIMLNISADLHAAAARFDPDLCGLLKEDMRFCRDEILRDFVDEDGVIHEIIRKDTGFFEGTLGQHVNPGHTLEDIWFMLDASEILGDAQEHLPQLAKMALRALEIGWDETFGGLYQYCALRGGPPEEPLPHEKDEPIVRQVVNDWSSKLWWVHTEALYCTLRLYLRTGRKEFEKWHEKVESYTLSKFPNSQNPPGEWIQILTREGKPEAKVVALPVKDPYHITRNLILCAEALG